MKQLPNEIKVRLKLIEQRKHEPHPDKPKTRADCVDGPRPCPWVSCRHNLAIDLHGSTVIERDMFAMELTCALDVTVPMTTVEIGELLGCSKQAIHVIEQRAMAKLGDEPWDTD